MVTIIARGCQRYDTSVAAAQASCAHSKEQSNESTIRDAWFTICTSVIGFSPLFFLALALAVRSTARAKNRQRFAPKIVATLGVKLNDNADSLHCFRLSGGVILLL